MHLHYFGSPPPLVILGRDGKSKVLTPLGPKEIGFVNPETKPKRPLGSIGATKQAIDKAVTFVNALSNWQLISAQ